MVAFDLPFPPSANTYYRRGRYATYLAPNGRAFKTLVAELISTHRQASVFPLEGRLSVFLSLYSPTRRSYDIDNRIKAVLDSLQDAGVYENDEQIDELCIARKEVTKGGKCQVVIVPAKGAITAS
jgi:crossover junction endodeoxyribonuclease RusA